MKKSYFSFLRNSRATAKISLTRKIKTKSAAFGISPAYINSAEAAKEKMQIKMEMIEKIVILMLRDCFGFKFGVIF